jgi:hypothetical protein
MPWPAYHPALKLGIEKRETFFYPSSACTRLRT